MLQFSTFSQNSVQKRSFFKTAVPFLFELLRPVDLKNIQNSVLEHKKIQHDISKNNSLWDVKDLTVLGQLSVFLGLVLVSVSQFNIRLKPQKFHKRNLFEVNTRITFNRYRECNFGREKNHFKLP